MLYLRILEASPVEVLYRKDLGDLNKDEIVEVKALIKKIDLSARAKAKTSEN